MPSKLLALTDEQLTTVFNMTAPLASHSRRCGSLGDLPELGDGVVARTCAEVQKRYWRAPDLSRGQDQRVSLSHLFALLIVLAPGARCEVDQRAFAHKSDASPIAIDIPGGSFADEFAQRIAWAEARTFTYLNHGKSLQSLCRGGGSISFIRPLHEFAISSLSAWDE
jgi:hypothetical protein